MSFTIAAFAFSLMLLRLASAQRSCVPLNVCFVIDESGSIGPTEFEQQSDAIVAIAQELSSFAPGSTLSAVEFSGSAGVVQSPTSDINGVFIPAIEGNEQMGGGTSIGPGLTLCETQLSSAADPRIIVLLTDGADGGSGQAVAPGIQNNGITIVSIGIGNGVNTAALQAIASSPDLFIPVSDFTTFQDSVGSIVDAICPVPECVNIDCAQCGKNLECYVNSGFDSVDEDICDVVADPYKFCPHKYGKETVCKQRCNPRKGAKCFPGTNFGSCPQKIGYHPKCMGRATKRSKGKKGKGKKGTRKGGKNKRKGKKNKGKGKGRKGKPMGQPLSNFASYTVCMSRNGTVEVTCLNQKCKDGSYCPCAQPFM